MTTSILTYIWGIPILAALVLIVVPGNYRVPIRALAVLATLISAVLAVKMFCDFGAAQPDAYGYRFVQQIPWVDSLGISYHVGVDGLNVGLILMGAIVAFAATLCAVEIQTREKEFYILVLVMSGGILGAFASLDFFFYFLLCRLTRSFANTWYIAMLTKASFFKESFRGDRGCCVIQFLSQFS